MGRCPSSLAGEWASCPGHAGSRAGRLWSHRVWGSRQASAGSNGLAEGRGTEVADGLLHLTWAMGKGGVTLVQLRGSSARVLW